MWVLTAGPVGGDSPGLVSSESMRARIAELRREFDFVLIDAAPVSPYGDVIPLGKMSDGVVLIVEAEYARCEAARAAIDHLWACRIPVLGRSAQ
jgi:polysaccharide biosynthesis transport protein